MINKRAVIYCRVSSKEQVDEGNSLVTQERLCREYALKEGYDLVEIFIEKGESAKTADRKEWLKLTAFCEDKKNHIDAVIAYKIDRVSRNMADYLQFKVRFNKHNVAIKSVTEFFDDTPAGRFMENIIANVGQFDNDVRTERSVGGMREAVLEGRYVWMAPIGYKNVRELGKSNIAPDDNSHLMHKVFVLISERIYSTDQIRLRMAAEGLVNKRGLPITRGNFFRLIRNPLYMGRIEKLGLSVKGSFTTIVSEELFTIVQNILKGRKNPTKTYLHEREDFPLRRFIQHPSGKKLTGYWSKGRSNRKYAYYSFSIKGTCYSKDKLENAFMDFLAQFHFDSKHLNAMKFFLEKIYTRHIKNQQTGREAIEKNIVEINGQIDQLLELHAKGAMSLILLTDRTKKLEKELEQLTDLLVQPKGKDRDIQGLFEFAAKVLQKPHILWKQAPFECKKLFQWFGFRQGLIFDGEKFRTTDIAPVFKLKKIIDKHLLSVVTHQNGTSNGVHGTVFTKEQEIYSSFEYWEKIVEDLEKLKTIYESNV